jgi:hypothetical protein
LTVGMNNSYSRDSYESFRLDGIERVIELFAEPRLRKKNNHT